jgi:hypothetical protein
MRCRALRVAVSSTSTASVVLQASEVEAGTVTDTTLLTLLQVGLQDGDVINVFVYEVGG